MNDLLQIIQDGNQNLEVALQALIKQEINNGQTVEVALQSLIKQAKEMDLEPALQALIRLQQMQHADLMKQLRSTPETQKVEIMGAEVVTIRGEAFKHEHFTEEQLADLKGEKGDSIKGDKGDPLEWDDLTPENKAELKGEKGDSVKGDKGDDGVFTEEHLKEVVTRVTPLLPTAKDIASLVDLPAKTIKPVERIIENRVTKTQIRDVVRDDFINNRNITYKMIIDMINSRKGRYRIDIDAIKGLQAWMQGGGGGRGEPHTFLEAPDTPSAYIADKWLKVNSEGTALILVDEPSGGSSATWVNEVPSGDIDGVNQVFTLDNTPIAGSLTFYWNGQFQRPALDYTLSGDEVTLGFAPFAGTTIYAMYQI